MRIKKKTLFLILGLINVLLTNLMIQIFLLFIPTIIATFVGQLFNFLFGFYFYGKKVFKVKKLNKNHLTKYIFLNVIIWNINWTLITYISSFWDQKNIIAFLIILPLALVSYCLQKYYVFK